MESAGEHGQGIRVATRHDEKEDHFDEIGEAQAAPRFANKAIEKARKVADKPIGHVVLTHYHALRVLGAIVGTPSPMGTPFSAAEAFGSILGFVLMNEWSARDIRVWENHPPGLFNAKTFGTSISPWLPNRQRSSLDWKSLAHSRISWPPMRRP